MPATIPAWTGTATVVNTSATGNVASFTAGTGGPNNAQLLKISPTDLTTVPDEIFQFLGQCVLYLKDANGTAFGFGQMLTLVGLWLNAIRNHGQPEQPTQVAH